MIPADTTMKETLIFYKEYKTGNCSAWKPAPAASSVKEHYGRKNQPLHPLQGSKSML